AGGPPPVFPHPRGRHPRVGFFEGAGRPPREGEVSGFAPRGGKSYVVGGVPEGIFSNLRLVYLAHTPTPLPRIWGKQDITLPKMEWNRREDGTLDIERKFPNGIVYGAKIIPGRDAVRMELWLQNGTTEPLSDLRVQNCVMLKGAAGFEQQTNDNKIFTKPYV